MSAIVRRPPSSLIVLAVAGAGIWAWWVSAQPGIDARTRARLIRDGGRS